MAVALDNTCVFDATTARMQALRSAFDEHGVIKLSRVFPVPLMDELRTAAAQEYSTAGHSRTITGADA